MAAKVIVIIDGDYIAFVAAVFCNEEWVGNVYQSGLFQTDVAGQIAGLQQAQEECDEFVAMANAFPNVADRMLIAPWSDSVIEISNL